MADMKIPASLPVAARAMTGARAEAIRNAQKAFFQAAMTQAQRPEPKPSAKPQSKTAAPADLQETDRPQRYLRPGSLLDIKV